MLDTQAAVRSPRDFHLRISSGWRMITQGDEVRPPPAFMCPIMGELMRDPVTTADGHTFERLAIEKWLRRHSTSPMTGATLPHLELHPAIALRQLIDEHRVRLGLTDDDPEDDDDELSS